MKPFTLRARLYGGAEHPWSETMPEPRTIERIILSLPDGLLAEITEAWHEARLPNRNAWIVEAIREKLARERGRAEK